MIHTIEFSPDGNRFATIGGKELIVVSIEAGSVLREESCSDNISSMCWQNDESLLLGHQNGTVTLVKLECVDVREAPGVYIICFGI